MTVLLLAVQALRRCPVLSVDVACYLRFWVMAALAIAIAALLL